MSWDLERILGEFSKPEYEVRISPKGTVKIYRNGRVAPKDILASQFKMRKKKFTEITNQYYRGAG